jgi:hypothetical protein
VGGQRGLYTGVVYIIGIFGRRADAGRQRAEVGR